MTALALFGGSFDPPHEAHLEFADLAAADLGVTGIHFVPARLNPLKESAGAAPVHRRHLLELLLDGRHGVLGWELERDGPSYTIDTVRRAAAETGARPVWLLGADCLESLHRWREIRALADEADLRLVARRGVPLEAPAELVEAVGPEVVARLIGGALTVAPADISSTRIRAELAEGKIPQGLTEPMVAYIVENGLYGFPRLK